MDEDFELYDGRHSGPEIDAILDEAQASLPAIESSIAIVANGNTAPQNITAGQYVYVKNHSTLPEGLYYNKSGSTIASGTTLTSSNLGAVSNGGLNELKSAITPLLSPTFICDIDNDTALNTNITVPSLSKFHYIFVRFALATAVRWTAVYLTSDLTAGHFFPDYTIGGSDRFYIQLTYVNDTTIQLALRSFSSTSGGTGFTLYGI